MQSAHYAIADRPYVCPSVCHTGGSVINAVEVRIMQLSPQSSPIPVVLRYKFNPEILSGVPLSGGVKQW